MEAIPLASRAEETPTDCPAGEHHGQGRTWTAVLLAGSRPGVDPLADHFQRQSKALIPVAGEAMLSRVLRTLLAVPAIGRVVLLAQDADGLLASPELAWLRGDSRVVPHLSGPTISGSILSLVEQQDTAWPVLVTTADNVLLTPAIATEFLEAADRSELAIGLVSRETLEAEYGESKRTWLRFRDGDFTGANLFALRSPNVAQALGFWEKVEKDRKRVWKLAARFGPRLLLNFLFRRLSLTKAIGEAGRRLNVRARPVILRDGRAGIDVDKPSDHVLAEAILAA